MTAETDQTSTRFRHAATEAANRAEATALLIRCGYRVYRPEADIEGEDMVVRLPTGPLFAVQLKSVGQNRCERVGWAWMPSYPTTYGR